MNMDEVRRLQRPAADLISFLVKSSDRLSEMLAEHIEDNDEVLPTLFLADVGRWYVASYVNRDSDPDGYSAARSVVGQLGQAYAEAEGALENTIAVGFIEAVIPSDGSVPEYCDDLPEPLRTEMIKMINWRPTYRPGSRPGT